MIDYIYGTDTPTIDDSDTLSLHHPVAPLGTAVIDWPA